MAAAFRCIGSIDIDPAGIRDFNEAGPGRPGTGHGPVHARAVDRFPREVAASWQARGHGRGHSCRSRQRVADIVFISSPCKGASGLLSESLSKTAKYQALNELTLRCIWLMCEASANDRST